MTHHAHMLTNIGSERTGSSQGFGSIFNLVRSRSPVRSNSDVESQRPKPMEKMSSDIDDFGPAQRSSTISVHGSDKIHESSFRVNRFDPNATGASPGSSRREQADRHNASFKHESSFRRAAGSLAKVTRSFSSDRIAARVDSTHSNKTGDASVSLCPSFHQMVLDSSMCMCCASVNVQRKLRAANMHEICGRPVPALHLNPNMFEPCFRNSSVLQPMVYLSSCALTEWRLIFRDARQAFAASQHIAKLMHEHSAGATSPVAHHITVHPMALLFGAVNIASCDICMYVHKSCVDIIYEY